MNSTEIFKILTNDPVIQPIFRGVFKLDNIPKIKKFPSILIINLNRHWVSLFIKNSKSSEYFDPLGIPPPSILEKRFNITQYNKEKVQLPNTVVCGHFIIYYLFFRSRGATFKNIIKSLTHKSASDMVEDFTMHLVQKQTETFFYK